ncbi:MAG: CbrC family protein [Ktedonobacterales bacterium]|nr:CbrC family protein [Ktedonobacterales bacterium]
MGGEVTMYAFEYFPTFPEGAQLHAEACEHCGRSPTIPAVRLERTPGEDNATATCADCLRAGRARAPIPQWVKRALARAVDVAHPDWSHKQRTDLVASRIDKLAHTPPVPWLQNNEWPVCHDDFARYMGELTHERLLQEHGSAERAKGVLRAIIEEVRPEWVLTMEDIETAWEQLGNFVAVFLFHCSDHAKTIYVLQTA